MIATDLIASRLHLAGAGGPNVPSPCVSVCAMDAASGWCGGCLRTIDEIAAWSVMDDAQKRQVWQLIGQRLESLKP